MPEAQVFPLAEAMAGDEETYLWVTLGFSSPEEPNDVLHIVVAKDVEQQDHELEHDTVYLERYDQSLSCYGGAVAIRASRHTVEVELDVDGQEALDLSRVVRFSGCDKIDGYGAALETLTAMQSLSCGRVVTVAPFR